MRTEPPVSVPIASGTMPAATAAPLPPLEPPDMRAGSHGLREAPVAERSPVGPYANSCVVVLPTMIAPASRNRVTQAASVSGMYPAKCREPMVAGTPATMIRSFTATGTPCSGPRSPPPDSSSSARRAAASAPPASTVTNAFSAGSSTATAPSACSTRSTEVVFRSRSSRARSVTVRPVKGPWGIGMDPFLHITPAQAPTETGQTAGLHITPAPAPTDPGGTPDR